MQEQETTATPPESKESSAGEHRSAFDALRERPEYKDPAEHNSGSAWNLDDDSPAEPAAAAGGESDADTGNDAESGERKKAARIPDEVKRASAETAALLYSETLQLICNPIVNHKFNRKFSDEERATILENDIEFKAIEDLDERMHTLKRKWDLSIKKRDAKIRAIPLDSTEQKRVQTAFYNYFKVTDKALGPEWLLAFTLISITVDRGIEVTTD